MRIIMLLGILLLTGCTSQQVKQTVRTISYFTGGPPPPRGMMLDSTTHEELDRQMKLCMDGHEYDHQKRADCVQQVYEKVKELKGLDQRRKDGTVIIKKVEDDEVINEQ